MERKFQFVWCEQTPYEPKKGAPGAVYVRRDFEVLQGLRSAKLHMTALGVYFPYVNGKRPDGQRLLPGFTDYRKRLQYHSFDVTELLIPGKNVVAAIVGEGWYRGALGPFNKKASYGDKLALAAVLELEYENGVQVLMTDESWKACQNGPLQDNDLKLLEKYDATCEIPDWNLPDFDDSGWGSCSVGEYAGDVIPADGEPILAQEQFTPKVLHTPDGSTVLDFGQNISGFVQFTVTGPAGHTVSLRLSEALDKDGNFTLKNLQGDKDGGALTVGQKLIYTLKEGTQTYIPYFLSSGFQYCKVENWPEEVKAENFTSVAVYSRLPIVGSFSCSNESVNRFVQNVIWSQKSNFVDIPTDCPHRERAGWAGDINVFIETANYLTDTRKFITKWLKDLILSQKSSGSLPYIVPPIPGMGMNGESSAGWSDAIMNVPMKQYLFYADPADVQMCYEAAAKFIEFNIQRAKKSHITNIFKRDADRRYVLDNGQHFGEWLEPGAANLVDGLRSVLMPDSEVATAWFYYMADQMAQAADLLDKPRDKVKYAALAKNIRQAYRKYFMPAGKVESTRQCKYVRPLYMGLADEAEKPAIAKALNDLCVKNNYKIGTGFLTTYQILQVLTDNGYADTAYRMLENRECPGWLYEVDKGATTIWEGWDAIKPDTGELGLKSLNHYAPGAAAAWLFSHCCGIRPVKPGFREIMIAPVPGGSFSWAKAEYNSAAGKIGAAWKLEEGKFTLDVVIPEGVTATLKMPDGTVYEKALTGSYTCGK